MWRHVLEIIQVTWEYLVSHFLRFLQVAYHPCPLFKCSSSDSRGCCGILPRRMMQLEVLVTAFIYVYFAA